MLVRASSYVVDVRAWPGSVRGADVAEFEVGERCLMNVRVAIRGFGS